MDIVYADIMSMIQQYFFPYFRITGLFLVAPIFSSHLVSRRLRLVISLVITIPIAFSVPNIPVIEAFTYTWYVTIIQQIIIGAAIGFVFLCTLQAFIVGGQVVAMQSGLGFASMVDPGSGVNVPVVSQLYLMITTLVFLSLNGHLFMLDIIAKSFHAIPISTQGILPEHFFELAKWTKWIFAAGVLMALPAIIALMIVNFCFGILARSAPQLNIFAVGFPVTLTLGLFIIFLTLSNMIPHIENMLDQALGISEYLLGRAING